MTEPIEPINELQVAMALKIEELKTKKSDRIEKMKAFQNVRKRQKTDTEKTQINNDKSDKRLERFEAKREKRAERLRMKEKKLQEKEAKYLQKEKEKEISDRLKQIDQSEKTIENIKAKILSLQKRTSKRAKTISIIEKNITYKTASLVIKKKKAEEYIENLKNQVPNSLESKLQNDISRLIEYRDRIQTRIDEKLEKIKSLNEIDNQEKIKTREDFIKNLESGVANIQNYHDQLNDRQSRDENKLSKLNTELESTIKRYDTMKSII